MARNIIVTGTSSGFGKEIALYLAERNFQVYATMRDLNRRHALEAAAELRHVTLRFVQLDVTDPTSIERAVDAIVTEAGTIEGLVNNAGVMLHGYFEDLLDEEIRQLFEVNVFGAMAVTRAVLPHMRAASRGRIIFITSVAGRVGSPSGSAYSATKFALEGFAESLMQEVAPLGIKTSIVEPGITKTESWTIDRAAGGRARDPQSPYYAWFHRAEQLFDSAMQTSPIRTVDVADAVYRALTEPRPRLRYVVGRRAALVIAGRRYIPSSVFDRVYFGEVMRRVANEA